MLLISTSTPDLTTVGAKVLKENLRFCEVYKISTHRIEYVNTDKQSALPFYYLAEGLIKDIVEIRSAKLDSSLKITACTALGR